MEKISEEQLNKLLVIIRKYGLMFEWILGICNISSLTDLSIVQYNYLLMLVDRIENGAQL